MQGAWSYKAEIRRLWLLGSARLTETALNSLLCVSCLRNRRVALSLSTPNLATLQKAVSQTKSDWSWGQNTLLWYPHRSLLETRDGAGWVSFGIRCFTVCLVVEHLSASVYKHSELHWVLTSVHSLHKAHDVNVAPDSIRQEVSRQVAWHILGFRANG